MATDSKSMTSRIPGLSFIGEARLELKKVTWPTRQQIIRLSGIVIIVSIATAAYLGALDYLFTQALGFVLNR